MWAFDLRAGAHFLGFQGRRLFEVGGYSKVGC